MAWTERSTRRGSSRRKMCVNYRRTKGFERCFIPVFLNLQMIAVVVSILAATSSANESSSHTRFNPSAGQHLSSSDVEDRLAELEHFDSGSEETDVWSSSSERPKGTDKPSRFHVGESISLDAGSLGDIQEETSSINVIASVAPDPKNDVSFAQE